MLGDRFNLRANYAVIGTTIGAVIFNQLPLLQALTTPPKYVMMEIGYNEWTSGMAAATFIAQYTTLCKATGVTLIAFTN